MVREKTEQITVREFLGRVTLFSVLSPLEQNKAFRRWWLREGTAFLL